MRETRKHVAGLLAALAVLTLAAGCSGGQGAQEEKPQSGQADGGSDGVRVLEVRYDLNAAPMAYRDEDGNDTGLDIELLRLVDELLPDYEFHIEGSSKDDVIAGITAGMYDVAVHNAFYTEERAEKFYISEENQGGSLAGFFVRKELGEELRATGKTGDALLEEFYDRGLRLAPMIAGDGRTFQVEQYNARHPDKALEIEYTSDMNIGSLYFQWIDEGRYDAGLNVKSGWDLGVVPEDSASHQYLETLDFVTLKAIKTYPLFSRITLDEDFLEAYTEALREVKASGKASELAVRFYGEDIYKIYPFEEGW